MKKIVAMLASLAMLLSLAACGSSSSTASSSNNGKLSLKISGHPYIHALPTVYAEKNGIMDTLFDDWSFDVYANGPVQNEAIATGAWEAGTTGIGGIITGAPTYNMKAIGFTTPDTQMVEIMVRPDSELAGMEPDEMGVRGTADDWRGKTVMCATGTICHMLLIATLEHLGLTSDDINLVDTSVPNGYASFIAGEGDIVCLWDTFSYQYENEGGVVVANCKGLGLNMPAVIVATEDALENNREAVVEWVKMYFDVAEKLANDPDGTTKLLYDYQMEQGITTTEEDCRAEVEMRPFISLDENLEMFKEDASGTSEAETTLLDFADFMISQGKLTEKDKQTMIDNNFVDGSILQEIAAQN